MASFFEKTSKNWRSWFVDDNTASYAAMYRPSGSSSSRDSIEESDVSEGLIEKKSHSGLPRSKHREPWWKKTTVLVVIHMVLFTLYAAILFVVINRQIKAARLEGMPVCTSSGVPNFIYSYSDTNEAPAIPALKWEEHKFTLEDRIQEKGSFSGKPSADLDKAWHDLLNCELFSPTKSSFEFILTYSKTKISL